MDKEEKKDDNGKILSEIKDRLQRLEFLAFMESVKRFELANGRELTRDERKNMAETLHISLDDFCALLKNISSDDFRRVTGLV